MSDNLAFKRNKYMIHEPTTQQAVFLWADHIYEILYGGAAGGGKSDALLMAALQYVDVPGYQALLFRRTYKDLALPGALMDRADEWLGNTDAKWDSTNKAWNFPSGARVAFGYMETERDRFRYASAEFQFIGYDELTQFTKLQYTFMFSRLRRLKGAKVPIRMRAASNPGGIGHEWVRDRFITNRANGRVFIPAKLKDNPHVDQDAYYRMLGELDPVTREQLEEGNWDARPDGGLFFRRNFQTFIERPEPIVALRVRAWDLAATPGDGDRTVGARFALDLDRRKVYVEDVVRGQWGSADRNKIIYKTALMDQDFPGTPTIQLLERQPGEAGKTEAESMAAFLGRFPVEFISPTGSKYVRSMPYQAASANQRIVLVKAPWNEPFIEEHVGWLGSVNRSEIDDQVDAGSMAYNRLYPEVSSSGAFTTKGPRQLRPRPFNRTRTSNP